MTTISHIITQHLEEVAFLWLVRESGIEAPNYSLTDLGKLDDRVDAHLDGLRIAGEGGRKVCQNALKQEESGEVFTASVQAFESGEESAVRDVIDVGCSSLELSLGVISALGWLPFHQAISYIERFLVAESSSLRWIGIAAAALHRQDPGPALVDALSDNDLLLRARALRAVGQLGRRELLPQLRENLTNEDEKCRFCAAWSATLLAEDAEAIRVLQAVAESNSPWREEAVQMAVRRMEPSAANDWLDALAEKPELARLAVIGSGVVGDVGAIPWLIKMMAAPALARVAGEAFTMLTGVDLAYEDMESEWPEGFEAGPTEDPEDENVEMDADENLPWPNAELIQRWWEQHQGDYSRKQRYLLGEVIEEEWLWNVLRNGRQRQRAAAAIELAIKNPGQPLFEVRAPGFRQQQMLDEAYRNRQIG